MPLSQWFSITVATEMGRTQEEFVVGVKVKLMTATFVIHSPTHKWLH